MRLVLNPILLLLLLPTLLILIWFRHGNIMATGESGIPFYDLNLQYEINKSAWATYTLGHPTNISVAGAPTYYFLSLIQRIGVPANVIQAIFFWLVLVSSGFGIYFLTKHFFPDIQKRYLILATLFYWFNPISMVNVWNRFLNNFLVFYCLLPLTAWLFIMGLKTKKYIFSILIGLASALLAYALTSMAFVLLFWLMLGYITLFNLSFKDSNLKERIFTAKFFLLTLFFWILVNFWWLNQVFSYLTLGSFDLVASNSFVPENNYYTFAILSERLGDILDILRLRHGTFFNDPQLLWIEIYNFVPIVFLEFIIIILMLIGAVLGRRNLGTLFFLGLFLGSVFLAKGNNPPFGEVVSSIFWRIPVFQLFRNPFEKFGFLLILSATPLFVYGIHLLFKRLNVKWRIPAYVAVIIFLFIWAFPFLTGLVFTSNETPTNDPNIGFQVKVPNYYRQASDWITQQNEDFRLIALPIGGEGITYKWDKGYSGVELTNQLLPSTSVSFATNIPFYEKVSKRIEEAFLNKGDFREIMNVLNARYVMERNDIDWQTRQMRDPRSIHSQILEKEKIGQLRKAAEFGKLSFWENTNWQNEKISVAPRVILSSPESSILDLQISDYPTIVSKKRLGERMNNLVAGEIIHPQAKFTLGSKLKGVFEIRQDLFPHVNVLPSSPLYQAILIKDYVEINSARNLEDSLRLRLNILGKRIVEAKLESERGNADGVMRAIEQYSQLLDSTLKLSKNLKSVSPKIITQEELYSIFFQHLSVLEDIKQNFINRDNISSFLGSTLENTQNKLVSIGIFPSFGFKDTTDFPIRSRVVFQFDVKSAGEFELKWGKQLLNNFYQIKDDNELLLQIDDQIFAKKVFIDEKGDVSFGKIKLNPGIHEIGLNTPEGKNLIFAPSEVNFKVDHGEKIVKFPIQNLDPYSTYSLTFDYWIKSGTGITILLEGNNSKIKNGVVIPSLVESIVPNFYDFTPKSFFSGLDTSEGADSASLIFKVEPWNDCEVIFYSKNRKRCKDINFRKAYDRTTEVLITNIRVTRNLEDRPFLIQTRADGEKIPLPIINFTKVNSAEYRFSVKEANSPFILILSELFDTGWQIISKEDEKELFEHFPVNSFANGWFIDKKGSFDLSIKYAPQKLLKLGEKISLSFFTGGLLIVLKNVIFGMFKIKKT